MPIVSVPGQGDVEFPDSMKDEEIVTAIKKLSTPPKPGIGTRALQWLTTPSKNMQPIIDENRATEGDAAFPLTKESGDVRAGAQMALSGVPGYDRNSESPDAQERMALYRKEHPALSILLPLAGGLGKPSALPVLKSASEAGPITQALTGVARKAGRRTLYGGANGLSERFPVPDSSIDAAFEAGAFKPGGTTEHAADVLSDALDEAGALKGDVVRRMEAAGIQGPDSANLAQLLRSKAAWLRKNTAGSNIPDLYEKVAGDIEAAGEGGRLGVQQGENIKQSLQDQAKYGMPGEKMLNRARRNIASAMRQGVEDAAGADAATLATPEAQAAAGELVPAKTAYALLAPAAKAAEKGLSQATKRNAFSLRDTIMAAPMAAAHGAGPGAAMALLTKAARTYGPSTIASAARGAAKVSGSVSPVVQALVVRGVPQELAESIAAELAAQNE